MIKMATSAPKTKKIVNAIEEDLEQLSSYDGEVAKRFSRNDGEIVSSRWRFIY